MGVEITTNDGKKHLYINGILQENKMNFTHDDLRDPYLSEYILYYLRKMFIRLFKKDFGIRYNDKVDMKKWSKKAALEIMEAEDQRILQLLKDEANKI